MPQILKRQHWAISYFAKMAISEPKQCKNHSKNDGQVFFQCRWLIIEAKYIREMRVISTIKDNIQAFENRTWLLPSIFLYPAPRSRSNRVMLLDEVVKTVTENTETFNSCFGSVFAMESEVLFIPPGVDRKFYFSNRTWDCFHCMLSLPDQAP